jgi:hypothetical protein
MRIDLRNIKGYFLTVDTNSKRKHHMLDEFKNENLTEVNPVIGIGKYKSGATGFCRMIDLALRNQDRSIPFQPFAIYEDDTSKYREYPEFLNIPDDADILYIGISKCSMNDKQFHYNTYYKCVDSEVIRIYNMLSTHGIIICSASGALAIQNAVLEAYHKNIIWDIFMAYIQPYYNVYALKNPLVYQDSKYGGAESQTKFTISASSDNILPKEYINTTNDSIITCTKVVT